MASNLDFIEFVCSSLKDLGAIRYRKMFGDYMVYVNEKPAVMICDNIAYVKKHPAISDLMKEAETGIPYDGAKEHYVLDVEHKDALMKIVGTLEKVLPYPQKKSKKNDKHSLRSIPNVGCTIDRCQLYLYRALEYFVDTENPDIGKCRWWYWKDDFFYPSPCGARCVECSSFPEKCKGCRKIKGKVFWLKFTGDDACPIWKCCKERKRENCGGCPELPCRRFMKDPSISDEENETNLRKMIENLENTR